MKPSFENMNKAESRAYLVAHPNDQEAFYAFVDRFTSDATSEIYDLPQPQVEVEKVAALIRQKVEQAKNS
ncbi:hypothetical protein ABN584_16160 [Gloeocapsa sp. BRSZ]